MDIISMAQQARPKLSGQMELLRAQFTALSSWVKMMPSSWRSLPKSSGLVRVTLLPRVVAMCASATLLHFDIGRKDIQTGGGDAKNKEEEVKECKSVRVKAGVREGVGGVTRKC